MPLSRPLADDLWLRSPAALKALPSLARTKQLHVRATIGIALSAPPPPNYGQRFAGLFVLGLPSINHAFTVASVAARDGEAGYLEPFFIYLPPPSPLGCSACRFRAARCYPLRCVYLTPSSGSSQKAGGGTIAKASQHKAVFRSQAFRNSKRCPNGQQCKDAESHLLSSSSAVHSRPCP